MVRKKRAGSRAIAAAIVSLTVASLATLAAPHYAQAEPPADQGTPARPAAQEGTAAAQVPQPDQGGVNWSGVGYGAASLASNVVYIPAKFLYALTGGFVGGASYVLTGGNSQTANTIWRSSLGGDYVVTPGMLQGNEPLHFSGPTTTSPEKAEVQPITQPSAGPTSAAPSGSSATGGPSTQGAPGVGSSSAGGTNPQPIDSGATGAPDAAGAPPKILPETSIE